MARVSRKNKDIDRQESIPQCIAKVYQTAIYVRISKEEKAGCENKIYHQEQFVRSYLKAKQEFQIVRVYCDNGFSGTNFERPSFVRMLQDIKNNEVNCIIVKDLSRLGRNHLETEQYLSIIFPCMGVRFIAVNDNYDSRGSFCDISISLKNIVNAAYAADISRKVVSAKQVQRLKGEFTGSIPPFGYQRSPVRKNSLVIHEKNSKLIRKIFELKAERKTNAEIAKYLNDQGEAAPMAYHYQNGLTQKKKYAGCIWEAQTIRSILLNQAYAGDMVQGKKKKYQVNGKVKCRNMKPEDYVVVTDTHEAIIPRTFFEKVQKICAEEKRGAAG